ncbi:MAG: alpha-L-fucosidase [Bacteroidetes bacterium RBG_13_44_24]|nr:MAG: alpha-L-fucosidase [Bacteroidetes bacterium RBG_13_44_24]
MKRLKIALILIIIIGQNMYAQEILNRDKRMEWWREARFGMFIHWGVYAVPAGEWKGQRIGNIGEWIMNRGKIPVADYVQIAKEFNPVRYDPEAWVKMAKDAGMKYIVITSKHHDGFALFETEASNWNVVDASPYGKDLLKPLADACRKNGIKLGFYYSQAQDWVNPGGSAMRRLTKEGWANPDSASLDAYTKAHRGHWDPAQETKTFAQYINDVAVPQVRELLTNYGDIAVLWWDTPAEMTVEAATKLQSLLALQPAIITNDRLKRPDFPGDHKTPEQRIPNLKDLDGTDWETCMTMNDTWGYKHYDHNYKSPQTLIRNLLDICSKGGNFLLNVGPTAEGEFPPESVEILGKIGQWMKINGEAVYGTKASPWGTFPWGRCTVKQIPAGTTLYFSVFEWPADGKLVVPGLTNKVTSASLLANGVKLKASVSKQGVLTIKLPADSPDPIASVVKINVKGKVDGEPVSVQK